MTWTKEDKNDGLAATIPGYESIGKFVGNAFEKGARAKKTAGYLGRAQRNVNPGMDTNTIRVTLTSLQRTTKANQGNSTKY